MSPKGPKTSNFIEFYKNIGGCRGRLTRNQKPPLVIPTGEVMGLRPTQADEKGFCSAAIVHGAPPFPLSSRPKRTRISYFALPATTTYAALLKESRTEYINATVLDRKSGGAQWRDLRFSGSSSGMFFGRTRYSGCRTTPSSGTAELSRNETHTAVYVPRDPKASNFIEFYKKQSFKRGTRHILSVVGGCGARAVESHISRKTSEMWGTRR